MNSPLEFMDDSRQFLKQLPALRIRVSGAVFCRNAVAADISVLMPTKGINGLSGSLIIVI